MPSIFSRILTGEIPSYKIAESEHAVAFLDVFPLVKGHTLVVPKREVDYYFDLSDEELLDLNMLAKKVQGPIKKAFPCIRIGVAVIGLEVPHAHMHLLPLNSMSDIDFKMPKLKLSPTEHKEIQEKILSYLS